MSTPRSARNHSGWRSRSLAIWYSITRRRSGRTLARSAAGAEFGDLPGAAAPLDEGRAMAEEHEAAAATEDAVGANRDGAADPVQDDIDAAEGAQALVSRRERTTVRDDGPMVGRLSVFRRRLKAQMGGHRHQVRQRLGLHLAHDLTSVGLHGDLADAEFATDLFVQQPGNHP